MARPAEREQRHAVAEQVLAALASADDGARLLRARFRDLRSEAVAGALSLSSLEVTDTILRW